MIARITTVAFRGLEAIPVDVQVMISSGKNRNGDCWTSR